MLTKKITILLILIFVTNLSCFFRNAEEMTADADEEIRRSQALQKLEKLCLNLPFFSEIKPSEKMVIRGRMISYKYRLDRDFDEIKEAYKNKLLGEGWTLTKEKRSVADDGIEFEKDRVSVFISHGYYGNENYSIGCKDRSIRN